MTSGAGRGRVVVVGGGPGGLEAARIAALRGHAVVLFEATDRLGGEPTERPVHFGEVFATLYHWLGIDLNAVTLPDLSGRPQYLVDGWSPMKELI